MIYLQNLVLKTQQNLSKRRFLKLALRNPFFYFLAVNLLNLKKVWEFEREYLEWENEEIVKNNKQMYNEYWDNNPQWNLLRNDESA